MKKINTETKVCNPCRLEGCNDLKYMLITLAAYFVVIMIVIFVFVHFSIAIAAICAGIFTGVFAFISLFIYLSFKNTYIEFNENGICGRARRYGITGFKAFKKMTPENFSYKWSEINKIYFGSEQLENQIGLEIGSEMIQYSFSCRIIRHLEAMEAIRSFGGKNLLDEKNITEVEESYSPKQKVLSIFGFIAIVILYSLYKFYLHGELS